MKKFALVLLLAACKTAPVATQSSGEDASRYYPLSVGNSWTYEEHTARKRETIRIVGQDGAWFFDDHRGRLRYESDGVRDSDRYLLPTPFVADDVPPPFAGTVGTDFDRLVTGGV